MIKLAYVKICGCISNSDKEMLYHHHFPTLLWIMSSEGTGI